MSAGTTPLGPQAALDTTTPSTSATPSTASGVPVLPRERSGTILPSPGATTGSNAPVAPRERTLDSPTAPVRSANDSATPVLPRERSFDATLPITVAPVAPGTPTAPTQVPGAPSTAVPVPVTPVMPTLPSPATAGTPGVSPVSGLTTAELPSVSAGTAPIGPQVGGATAPIQSATNATAPVTNPSTASEAAARSRTRTLDSAAVATGPAVNASVGSPAASVVPTPPPAGHAEVAPPTTTNAQGQVWVAGHNSYAGGKWTWVDGSWQQPPQAGATWVSGRYEASTKRWTEGYWDSRDGAAASRNSERAAPKK